MDFVRGDLAHIDQLLHLSNGDPGGRADHWVEVSRCLAEYQVAHLSPFHALMRAKSACSARSMMYVLPSNSRVSFPFATIVPAPAGVKNAGMPAPPARMRSAKVPWGTSSRSSLPLSTSSSNSLFSPT